MSSEYRAPPTTEWSSELPGTSVELILETTGRWEIEVDGHWQSAGSFAAGLVDGPVRTRPTAPVHLVQVALDPLLVPAVLGLPAGELAGAQIIDLDALLGARASEVLERIAGRTATDGGGSAAATDWVARELGRGAVEPPPDVVRAVALLRASRGRMSVDALARELGCSRRHLARRFALWVGVSPGQFARLLRLNRAASMLRHAPRAPLAEIAAACGYSDQAHMTRTFSALAGVTPAVWAVQAAERQA